MAVKVITDSTCDLPRELPQRWDIGVIPCNVHFDDQVYKDGVDMGPDEFYSRLSSSSRLPTTAQPSVNDFMQVYRPLCDDGHDVVSIHLSAKFSGTLNSATQAREALMAPGADGEGPPRRIEIIDSKLTSMGLGLATLMAARLARDGASCDQVVESVRDSLPRVHCYFLLDTLAYLQKGGRIGKASAFLGSVLNIKPLLMIRDGEAHPAERVRTWDRGLRRLVEIVRGLGPAESLSVLHSTAPEAAEVVRERLADMVPSGEVIMARFGPVIGTYLGPGALGVSLVASR